MLQLGQEARDKGFALAMGAEYLPFIEASAQTGEWSAVYNLSMAAVNLNQAQDLRPTLCQDWKQFASIASGGDKDSSLAKASAEFCKPANE